MSRFLKQRPVKSGLYDPEFEKDSCGVGLVANIKGVPSREIMENAYLINSRMDHRGGCGFEENHQRAGWPNLSPGAGIND